MSYYAPMEDFEAEARDLQKSLDMERSVYGAQTPESTTRRIFRENLPMAAMSLVQLACDGENARIRLDAAKYIVDRGLGRINEAGDLDPSVDPLEAMIEAIYNR